MDIGICVPSHVGDTGYVVRAEELGFSHAWMADSQMLWSDCYAALALAADKTSTIQLGTGVAVSGTRPAPVNAASIATINAIAPGRTFFGVGAGNTAMRVMGLKPQRIREFGDYLRAIKPLLRGEEAESNGKPIRHIMPDRGFVNFDDPIPMYVSGFGPRSLGLAGALGDGAVLGGVPNTPGLMENTWRMIEQGATDAGRELDRSTFYTTALTAIAILEPGEAVDSVRVKSEVGAMVMASIHYQYDQFRNFGHQPGGAMAEIWEDYTAMLEAVPAERRHQRIHAGHNCWVIPEEERFVTPNLIERTCVVGSRDQVIERLSMAFESGLDQVMILPNFDTRFAVLEKIGKAIVGNVA